MLPTLIDTPRLQLSVLQSIDAERLAAVADDPQIALWTPLPSPYGIADAQRCIIDATSQWVDGDERNWAIRCAGTLIGMIGVKPQDAGVAEVGYWLASDARGSGYAAEALAAVVDAVYADTSLAMRRIVWRAGVGNISSARTAQKAGFRYEGIQRQALSTPRTVRDGWIAALLRGDDRSPQHWPVLPARSGGVTRPESTVLIRSIDEGDVPAAVELWTEVGLTRPWNDPLADIERALAVDRDLVLVAQNRDRLVGTVLAGYDGHRGWLYYLASAPDHRGQGIGRALIDEAERRLLARGCPKVHLMVRPENTLVRPFYERLGYVPFETWIAGKRLIIDG